jgi:hypothetical protein
MHDVFFSLPTPALVMVIVISVFGAAAGGWLLGRRLRSQPTAHHEPAGVVHGAVLGLVGLLLAFGLSMAVGRYDARRALLVHEANDLSTTYLRAQLLAEPERSESLELLERYAVEATRFAQQVPDTASFNDADRKLAALQDDLWAAAGRSVDTDPVGTAPRLYTESLNDLIDRHTDRTASLRNRIPGAVLTLQLLAGALAVGALALYLTLLGRGLAASLVAAGLVVVILFVTFDLDRPERGFIKVPAAPLQDVVTDIQEGPAFERP